MEVKIHCPCGTRYKFDVEPVDAQLPGPVSCPTCGADGTGAANASIQQALRAAAASYVMRLSVAAIVLQTACAWCRGFGRTAPSAAASGWMVPRACCDYRRACLHR